MQNMAEKVEMFAGWDWDSSVIVGREMNQHLPNRCTVVVHDDKAERVFTESEVKAMMEDVKAIAAEHSRKCYTNRIEQMTPPAPVAFIIDDYLRKKHGITLDPS